MSVSPIASVGIYVGAVNYRFFEKLAELMRRKHGARIHLYVRSTEDSKHALSQNGGLWDTVTSANILSSACWETGLDESAVIARARAYEAKIGESLNRLILSHRHLGRGYNFGGFRYMRCPRYRSVTNTQLLHACNESLAFWEREIAEKRLTLILQGPKEAACVARLTGTPYRFLTSARYANYWYWATDEYHSNPALARAYQCIASAPAAELNETYTKVRHKFAAIEARLSLANVPVRMLNTAVHVAYWQLRGYEKARNIPPFYMISFPLREWLAFRRVTKLSTTRLSDLAGKPFVFFPLHKEPEAALHIRSPEYFYQHTAIASLSRDLPPGVLLAVKENLTSLGRRPADFYEQLSELKNVVFLDIRESGIEAARHAAVTATITGTAGQEAAILGKPVITFGRHAPYGILPHVMTVTDEVQLRRYLSEALEGRVDPARAAADGARYLQALKDSCLELPAFMFTAAPYQVLDASIIENAYRGLFENLVDAQVRPGRSLQAEEHRAAGSVHL